MLPDFIILGAQKSASTFLHRCLQEHPKVYMPKEEIHFFENPEYQQSTAHNLEDLFKNVTSDKIIGIKRPDYLAKDEVPERIYQLIPDAKLLVVVRNPLDRAISAYYYYIKVGVLPTLPHTQGLPMMLRGTFPKDYPNAKEVLDYGLYAKHLSKYFKLFPRENILILVHDDVVSNPAAGLFKVCDFLGLDSSYRFRTLNSRKNEGLYSLPRLRWLRLRNRFLFDYSENRSKLYARKKMPFQDFLVAGLITGVDKWGLRLAFGNSKPVVNGKLRKDLVSYYKDDVGELGNLLGRDFTYWIQE